MSEQVTFIHAADLHLGAPFRGLRALSESWAKRLLTAIPESYNRVVEAAIKNKVDFVIIAGDIFDSAQASYADYLSFFKGLNRLNAHKIPVYLCAGNHDPYTSWQQEFFSLPPNVTMFSAEKPEFAVFEKEGKPQVIVGGRSYCHHSWPKDKDISEGLTREAAKEETGIDAPFVVGVLHTGLNFDPEKAPTDPKRLLHVGMDYWALGHIHLKYSFPPSRPQLAFSGCIQGRDIKETGERGVYKVTLAQGESPHLEFIPTASVVWQRMTIDISECMSFGEIHDLIVRELFYENSKAQCEEMCVRITLTGKTELHRLLTPHNLADMRKSINDTYPLFFCDALSNKTVQPLDKEALIKEKLFPSVFLQTSAAFRKDEDEEVVYLEEEFLKKGLHLPRSCEKDVALLAEEAEDMVLDLLSGGESSCLQK